MANFLSVIAQSPKHCCMHAPKRNQLCAIETRSGASDPINRSSAKTPSSVAMRIDKRTIFFRRSALG